MRHCSGLLRIHLHLIPRRRWPHRPFPFLRMTPQLALPAPARRVLLQSRCRMFHPIRRFSYLADSSQLTPYIPPDGMRSIVIASFFLINYDSFLAFIIRAYEWTVSLACRCSSGSLSVAALLLRRKVAGRRQQWLVTTSGHLKTGSVRVCLTVRRASKA